MSGLVNFPCRMCSGTFSERPQDVAFLLARGERVSHGPDCPSYTTWPRCDACNDRHDNDGGFCRRCEKRHASAVDADIQALLKPRKAQT